MQPSAFKLRTFAPGVHEVKADVSKESTSTFQVQVEEVADVRHGDRWTQEKRLLNVHKKGDSVFLMDGTDKYLSVRILCQAHYQTVNVLRALGALP
jgi:hypothetical protein